MQQQARGTFGSNGLLMDNAGAAFNDRAKMRLSLNYSSNYLNIRILEYLYKHFSRLFNEKL